jgi:molybdate transport system substrate-binding protein
MKFTSARAILSLIFATLISSANAQINVAAAADLQPAFQDLATRFQKETGKKVKISYGSSGNFFTQIQNGAPFDLFFSADIDYPKKLEAYGLAEPGTLYSYATGKIVLWVPADSALDPNQGLKVLLDPRVKKIAIANPDHAPYGRAAVAALKREGLYEQISPKFVLGENISQTMSFVSSGNADIGVVAMSLALSPALKGKGKYAEIPSDTYPPILQGAVVLRSAVNKQLAIQFLDFVKSKPIQGLLRDYGFSIPSTTPSK